MGSRFEIDPHQRHIDGLLLFFCCFFGGVGVGGGSILFMCVCVLNNAMKYDHVYY